VDDSLVQSEAVYAGDFDNNVPIYIGRGLVRENQTPGRIQIGRNANFFYSLGLELESQDQDVEYLFDDEKYSFSWVDGDECVSNAVRVGKYYIGKVELENGRVFIGKVYIARNGLYFENSKGKIVLIDKYQVLTCKMSCSGNDIIDEIDVRMASNDLNRRYKELQDDFKKIQYEKQDLAEKVNFLKREMEYSKTISNCAT
jgi:Protein of unknown function (DUF3421)